MQPTPHSPNDAPRRGVLVEVRDLHRSFGETPVLRGITLTVEPGELFVVMGPSGSGKSVLLKHIIGLETPDQGQILIEGQPILSEGLMDNVRIAMVFQSGALLNSLTVAENVGLYLSEHRLKPPPEIDRIVTDKLNLVGLAGQEDRYPSELSGGMRKRVAIARALVVEPQLILYDEPTSELDPLVAVVIADEIENLKGRIGVTSIVVTHDRELAFGIADRIALLHEGEIIAVGSPRDLQSNADPRVHRFLSAGHRPQPQPLA
jgi:phospholipid/cholesterol/gamma-HCH transport system ATP-binding protein